MEHYEEGTQPDRYESTAEDDTQPDANYGDYGEPDSQREPDSVANPDPDPAATSRSASPAAAADNTEDYAPPTASDPDPFPDPVRDQDVAEETRATQTHRVPGTAVLTQSDKDALEERLDEPVAPVAETDSGGLEPVDYEGAGVAARSVTENYLSRSNIAADGPGTVGQAIRAEGTEDDDNRATYRDQSAKFAFEGEGEELGDDERT